MDYSQWLSSIARDAQRRLGVPAGWWGKYNDVRGPKGQRVHFSSGAWTLALNGKRVSRHDSRVSAIAKGRKL